jgi:hypothetical protein
MANSRCLIWPAPDNVPDADIVGRIKEGHGSALFPNEAGKISGVTRIAAQEAVITQFRALGHVRRPSNLIQYTKFNAKKSSTNIAAMKSASCRFSKNG